MGVNPRAPHVTAFSGAFWSILPLTFSHFHSACAVPSAVQPLPAAPTFTQPNAVPKTAPSRHRPASGA